MHSNTQISHEGIIFHADSEFKVRFPILWLSSFSRNKVWNQPLYAAYATRFDNFNTLCINLSNIYLRWNRKGFCIMSCKSCKYLLQFVAENKINFLDNRPNFGHYFGNFLAKTANDKESAAYFHLDLDLFRSKLPPAFSSWMISCSGFCMMISDDFFVCFHFSLFPIPYFGVYLSVHDSQVQWTLNDEVSVQISICNVIDLDDDKWFLLMDRLGELQRLITLKWNYESFTEENQQKENVPTSFQTKLKFWFTF